jgi:hypothetical protein
MKPNRIEPFRYSDCRTPAGYVCRGCAASNCKLWRGYNVICDIELLCCDCAAKEEHEDISDIDERGRSGGLDQIGSFVPAVPTEEGDAFWSYSIVPPNGCGWWYGLPTRALEGT